MQSETLLTADLARAARALAQVSADTVAESAVLTTKQIRDFERGLIRLDAETKQRLRRTLESYGVEFLAESDDHGYGVRQKFNSTKSRRLNTWENEGGPVYEDDI
ncbi:MAG: hypothetical protein ACTHXA_02480 [Gulosibacter sp.]|uniref:hypothetical protein n=1 Tax=Gulosibacter sp. TaxID=2817531 RepID=UPI003F92AB24